MQVFCFFLFTEIKDGAVVIKDLEWLSSELGTSWKFLARALKFHEAAIQEFDHVDEKLREKSYQMLRTWKSGGASKATYEVLYKALCDKLVERRDLAEKYCFVNKSTDKEESTSEGWRLIWQLTGFESSQAV